jgi:hypothetical protein
MTSAPTIRKSLEITAADRDVRLKLKPKAPTTGFVDGGWWPRSRDLEEEMPALIARLTVRLGSVECVSYNLAEWHTTPRKITADGEVVRLAGYRTQHHATIDVIGANQRLTLLVVPPETQPQPAHAALLASGHRGNTDTIETLLSTPTTPPADEEHEQQHHRDLDDGPADTAT